MGSLSDPPDAQNADKFIPPWMLLPDEELLDMATERGVGYVEPQPQEIEEALTCTETPPCTDFLADPQGVLRDRARLPNHLCEVEFMYRSTQEWAQASPAYLGMNELIWRWPLPVGGAAVWKYGNITDLNHLAAMPFEEMEEALWALHLDSAGGALDLFGLGVPHGGEGTSYTMGELKYVLRGSGEELFGALKHAIRWWNKFRGEETGGRPAGSGTYESSMHLFVELRRAVRALRVKGQKPTQENVASYLLCAPRALRRQLKRHGLKLEDVSKIP